MSLSTIRTITPSSRLLSRQIIRSPLSQPCSLRRHPPSLRLSTTAPPSSSPKNVPPPKSNALPQATPFLQRPAPPPSKILLSLTILTLTSTYAYLHTHLGGTQSLSRTLSFYSLAIPSYLHYRYHMALDSPDDIWHSLHEDTSLKGLNKILELQGFYIKSGQMCAANIGNAFPPVWVDTMSVLQDDCPARPFDEILQIIESEYDKPWSEVFESIESTPIGAASIGQVHRAKLTGGENVVIKIMYPNVESVFRGDVRTIKLFCRIAQPVHVPPLEEIEKQFMTEFDYVQEGKQLDLVRRNMKKHGIEGLGGRCRIPRPYLELCTKRVLVMEELKGDKLVVELKRDMERQKRRLLETSSLRNDGKAEEFANEFQLGQGPTSEQYERWIGLLNARRKLRNFGAGVWNGSVGWLPGVGKKEYEDKSELPINHAKLMDDLLFVHGNQILVDGCFNGDPHPGNILLLGVEEGKPQLGLIDYGQVKVLTKPQRLLFCQIIVALANNDKKSVVALMKKAGYKTKYMDPNILYRFATLAYDEDNSELTEGQHIQVYMESLHDDDPVENLPQEYIMASRVTILLRGLGHAVHQSRSVAKAWKPIAEKELEKEGLL